MSVPAVRRASPPGHASLGKQTLCQLSYSRSGARGARQTCILARVRSAINGAGGRGEAILSDRSPASIAQAAESTYTMPGSWRPRLNGWTTGSGVSATQ